MGRIQSSIGLITGTDIAGTVDQLISLSSRPRDRLVARTDTLQAEGRAIAELTASVIGVQLAGNQLSNASTFRSKAVNSSDSETISATAGSGASTATHQVRTLQTAATHNVRSLQRHSSPDDALGYAGSISINPDGGLLDASAALTGLNEGRGVEAGSIRITDRSGSFADIDLSDARTIDDVLTAINDAEVDVRATTVNNQIQLIDESGSTSSNLRVEQLGSAETAADLGLWGIDSASSTATGIELELPSGTNALRGVSLSELSGGNGIGPLGNLDIELADGSSASIDLSAATSTSEVIDAIDASGLDLIVRLNDARNGFQVRDVSGGSGSITISSVDTTADELGLTASTTSDIVVGSNLNRQTVTTDTLLSDLNAGLGVDTGSFTVTDSDGVVSAVNLTVDEIETVGDLVDAINALASDVTASLNEAGDGIQIVDNAGGAGTLEIADSGNGTTATDLGFAGTATDQNIGGNTVSALVGTQASVIDIAADDTLSSIVEKINDDGRYGTASVVLNDDTTYSLSIQSNKGGEAGKIAINTSGFEFDFRTESRGRDALIAVSTDEATERFLTSSDGVFEINGAGSSSSTVTTATLLTDLTAAAGSGSFTVTDSNGERSAVNLTVEEITTVGELVNAINGLGLGVSASINEDGTGISVVDTAGGTETLTITDSGNGAAASGLGIAGEASEQTVNGASVTALIGPATTASGNDDSGGLVLTVKQLSDSPITVTVEDDTSAVETAARSFVTQFNLLADKIQSLTFFDAESQEVGLLFGSSESLRIENGYSRLLSGRINSAGGFKSIGQVGISFNDQGKLDLDSSKLNDALETNAADVEAFFTTEETGLADRLSTLADRIAGAEDSLLINRSQTLRSRIELNGEQTDKLNKRLEVERERLLQQFYATEEAISKIQSGQSAIDTIKPITI
ncbi:MAG: flagellar filament capping protein FliD [Rubripirellula sp.]